MYIAKPHQQQLLSHILDDDSTSSETDHLFTCIVCVTVCVQCTGE